MTVKGVVFTQQGVPVKNSSDYQKVIDSRWVFMEVEHEADIATTLPATAAIDSTLRYFEKTIIYRHNLGFMPAFEASISFPGDPVFNLVEIFSDENTIFLRRLITSNANPAQLVTGKFRLYNLPILKDYEAPTEIVSGSTAPKTNFGVKFIDGSVPNTSPADNAVRGFSVDTTKKILSVHKHGLKYFNKSALASHCLCTAIDTATNILTVAPRLRSAGVYFDFTWVSQPGIAVTYSPTDFVTFPAPMQTSNLSYTIPIDATHIQLSGSYQAALARNPIDFTSAGSLPGFIAGAITAGEDTITHGIGYSPTFLLAQVNEDELTSGLGTKMYIEPLTYNIGALIKADSKNLVFRGVQSLFAGQFGYIILKDPAEIAQ